jgi:hypothetical protein
MTAHNNTQFESLRRRRLAGHTGLRSDERVRMKQKIRGGHARRVIVRREIMEVLDLILYTSDYRLSVFEQGERPTE